MLDAFKAELFKLRVRRAVIAMLVGLAAISALIPVVQVLVSDPLAMQLPGDIDAMWEIQNFGSFLFAGLGAVLVGGEFRSRVLTTELVRGQTRFELIGAKLLAFLVLGISGAIAIGLSMIVGVLIATLIGEVDIADGWLSEVTGDWLTGIARASLALAAGAIFGGACGMVARSTGAAVGIALAYLAFIEPAATAVIDLVWHVQNPPVLFFLIDALRGDAFGPGGRQLLSAGEAGLALAGWLGALSLLQIVLFVKRDVA